MTNEFQTELNNVAKRCTALRTLMTARSVSRLYDHAMKPLGLTGTQFTLLVSISSQQFKSISELGEALNIEKSTLSRNLRPLLTANLIERDKNSTGRAISHVLTRRGELTLEKAYPVWKSVQDTLEAEIGEEELGRGYAFLKNLRKASKTAVSED